VAIGRDRIDGRLHDRVAIVTGGTSGIGHATAIALAREGAHVVIVARTASRIVETIAALERSTPAAGTFAGVPADVTVEEDMTAMAERTLARFGRIDVLVACAGIGRPPDADGVIARPVAKLSSGEWDAVIDTNLKGTFLSNRAVLRSMIARRRGDIINVASARGAVRGQAFAAAYCASKFGVVGLSQALAEELAAYAIRVQVLLPDVTRTQLLERSTLSSRLGPLLPVERVAAAIVTMLTLPGDTVLREAVVAPMHARLYERIRT